MRQTRCEPRLALEARTELFVGGEVLRGHLDGGVPVRPLVACEIDRRHAAAAELALDAVAAPCERLRHAPSFSCFLWWPLCLPCPWSFAGGEGDVAGAG